MQLTGPVGKPGLSLPGDVGRGMEVRGEKVGILAHLLYYLFDFIPISDNGAVFPFEGASH